MSESTDQQALFDLFNRLAGLDEFGREIPGVIPRVPLLRFVFHPANEANGGGKKTKNGIPLEAITNARMGVRPGVPDLIAPFNNQQPIAGRPAGTFVGCSIEMKSEAGKLSPAQRIWLAHLSAHGWYTAVTYDWPSAARLLIAWAGGNPKEIEGL